MCLESPGLEFHVLKIHQAFTIYNNPKSNADTERCMRPLKIECPRLHEWTCPCTLIRVVESWIDDDNEHYLHSALDYKTPKQVERESYTGHSIPNRRHLCAREHYKREAPIGHGTILRNKY